MISETVSHTGTKVLVATAIPGAGVTTVTAHDARFLHTNVGPRRQGEILLEVDSEFYLIRFTFTDEMLDARTVQGYIKESNPEARKV